jgi:ketosteroid isomerase-like protein
MTIARSLMAGGLGIMMLAAGAVAATGSASAKPAGAEDRAAIADLMSRYMFALDSTDPDAYAAVFTDDAELSSGGGVEHGHAEIMKMVQGLKDRLNKDASGPGRHFIGLRHIYFNLALDVDGNTAKGEAYWQTIRRQDDGNPPIIIAMGRYEDEFVKKSGHWLIVKRAIINDMMTPKSDDAGAKKD